MLTNRLINKLSTVHLSNMEMDELQKELTTYVEKVSNSSSETPHDLIGHFVTDPLTVKIPAKLLNKGRKNDRDEVIEPDISNIFEKYYRQLNTITEKYLTSHNTAYNEIYQKYRFKRIILPLIITGLLFILVFFGKWLFPFLTESVEGTQSSFGHVTIETNLTNTGQWIYGGLFGLGMLSIFYIVLTISKPFDRYLSQITDRCLRKPIFYENTTKLANNKLTLEQGQHILSDMTTVQRIIRQKNDAPLWSKQAFNNDAVDRAVTAQYLNLYSDYFYKQSCRQSYFEGVRLILIVIYVITIIRTALYFSQSSDQFPLFMIVASIIGIVYQIWFYFQHTKPYHEYLDYVVSECKKLGCRLEKDG